MRRHSFWERLWAAVVEVFSPLSRVESLKQRLTQLAAWAATLGATAWAGFNWSEVLPPSWRGQLIIGSWLLSFAALGVGAAYRLQKFIDELLDEKAVARQETRRQVVVAIHQILATMGELQKAVLEKSSRRAISAVERLKNEIREYAAVSRHLTTLEASKHAHIQAEMLSAIETSSGKDACERLFPPILEAFGFAKVFGRKGGGILTTDELLSMDNWLHLSKQIRAKEGLLSKKPQESRATTTKAGDSDEQTAVEAGP